MSTSKADAKVSISQLGGICGFMRNPGLFLYTLRRGGYVGQDALGNKYFERPGRQKGGRTMRWVVYAGAPEASTVGPEWHAWLHHLTDEPLPSTDREALAEAPPAEPDRHARQLSSRGA